MDINEIQDTRSSFDRVGDRTLRSWKNEFIREPVIVIALILTIGWLAVTTANLLNDYMATFSTTKEAMVEKFYPIENVPMWKIVQVTE